MIGSAALDGNGDDLPCLLVCGVLQLGLDLLDLHGGFVTNLTLHRVQKILFGLLLGQPGDLLQGRQLLLLDFLGLGLDLCRLIHTAGQLLLLLFEGIGFLVQGFFLLLQTTLLLAQLGTALFDFFLMLGTGFVDLVLCFQKHFFFAALAAADGFVNQPGSLCLGRADLPLANALTVADAGKKADSH